MITSIHNPALKEIRRLHRREARERAGRLVVEGEDLLAAAELAGWPAVARFVAEGATLEGGLAEVEAWAAAETVEPRVLAQVSTLGSGSRALGIYEQRWGTPAGPLCVYLHGVRDPGNVGAVLRSAVGFEADSVVLGPGCADPFSPKAVRASMGAVFAVPIARGGPDDLPGERVALVAHAGKPLRGPVEGEVSVVVGAEREGLPEDVVAACDRVAHIPIASESLNAAMAATVALYELTRIAP